ncbi:hypothetical protein DMC30DRAFT_391111 [Rhodotorula diobovata]|uniref:Uncharacterized protein n=1 Tax=Rhodotorula diobovata TaxID=5288 RepID=A0A5C5G2T7_9BASI|nr:hypothetical protein DMC30DRAFT_391111 [Rhodotorula diobovata]
MKHPALSSMSEPVDLATQHAAEPSTSPKAPLALPAPSDVEGGVTQLEVNGQSFSLLGKMGPTVVNSDGTLSRIANWSEMIPSERARILRVLGKRNGVRLENKRAELAGQEGDGAAQE